MIDIFLKNRQHRGQRRNILLRLNRLHNFLQPTVRTEFIKDRLQISRLNQLNQLGKSKRIHDCINVKNHVQLFIICDLGNQIGQSESRHQRSFIGYIFINEDFVASASLLDCLGNTNSLNCAGRIVDAICQNVLVGKCIDLILKRVNVNQVVICMILNQLIHVNNTVGSNQLRNLKERIIALQHCLKIKNLIIMNQKILIQRINGIVTQQNLIQINNLSILDLINRKETVLSGYHLFYVNSTIVVELIHVKRRILVCQQSRHIDCVAIDQRIINRVGHMLAVFQCFNVNLPLAIHVKRQNLGFNYVRIRILGINGIGKDIGSHVGINICLQLCVRSCGDRIVQLLYVQVRLQLAVAHTFNQILKLIKIHVRLNLFLMLGQQQIQLLVNDVVMQQMVNIREIIMQIIRKSVFVDVVVKHYVDTDRIFYVIHIDRIRQINAFQLHYRIDIHDTRQRFRIQLKRQRNQFIGIIINQALGIDIRNRQCQIILADVFHECVIIKNIVLQIGEILDFLNQSIGVNFLQKLFNVKILHQELGIKIRNQLGNDFLQLCLWEDSSQLRPRKDVLQSLPRNPFDNCSLISGLEVFQQCVRIQRHRYSGSRRKGIIVNRILLRVQPCIRKNPQRQYRQRHDNCKKHRKNSVECFHNKTSLCFKFRTRIFRCGRFLTRFPRLYALTHARRSQKCLYI